jgi:hypothetical protein
MSVKRFTRSSYSGSGSGSASQRISFLLVPIDDASSEMAKKITDATI